MEQLNETEYAECIAVMAKNATTILAKIQDKQGYSEHSNNQTNSKNDGRDLLNDLLSCQRQPEPMEDLACANFYRERSLYNSSFLQRQNILEFINQVRQTEDGLEQHCRSLYMLSANGRIVGNYEIYLFRCLRVYRLLDFFTYPTDSEYIGKQSAKDIAIAVEVMKGLPEQSVLENLTSFSNKNALAQFTGLSLYQNDHKEKLLKVAVYLQQSPRYQRITGNHTGVSGSRHTMRAMVFPKYHNPRMLCETMIPHPSELVRMQQAQHQQHANST